MKTWKNFIIMVTCVGLVVGFGLIGCGDDGDVAIDDEPAGCQDNDGDEYGNPSSTSCANLELDCDDNDADVYPGAPEDCADGIDNDCDGLTDGDDPDCVNCTDADGDGFGIDNGVCTPPFDCNDTDAGVYPGAPEFCDGIDNQCPGDEPFYGIVDGDAVCRCSFDGGSFIFTLEDEDTREECPDIDMASLFPPGGLVGPVELPGFQDLPETIEIPFGRPIGTVSAGMFSLGEDIRFELSIPGVGGETATLTGAFCPGLPGQIEAAFTVTITIPSSDVSCYVEAHGTPAGG